MCKAVQVYIKPPWYQEMLNGPSDICSKPSMSSNGCLVIECSVTAMAVLISCASIQQCRAEQTSRVSLCRYRVAS